MKTKEFKIKLNSMTRLAQGLERNCLRWAQWTRTFRCTVDVTVGPEGITFEPIGEPRVIRQWLKK